MAATPLVFAPGEVVILRDDDLFRAKPLRRLNPARDRFLHMVGNTSVFRYRIGAHSEIVETYLADPRAAAARASSKVSATTQAMAATCSAVSSSPSTTSAVMILLMLAIGRGESSPAERCSPSAPR